MVRKCVVPGCSSGEETEGIKFSVFPTVNKTLNKLSTLRLSKWLEALGFRSHYNPSHKYVCSLHFESGKAAKLTDVNNTDWIPTLFLSGSGSSTAEEVSLSSGNSNDTGLKNCSYTEFVRAIEEEGLTSSSPKKLKLMTRDDSSTMASNVEWSEYQTEPSGSDEQETSVANSAGIQLQNNADVVNSESSSSSRQLGQIGSCEKCSPELENCRLQNAILVKQVDGLQKELKKYKRGMEWLKDDKRCKRYTGLNHYSTLKRIFDFVEPHLFQPYCNFSKEQMFMMTLQKLRKNQYFTDLADEYGVCTNSISKYFHRTLFVIHDNLKYALKPIPPEVSIRHLPKAFRDQYGNRRVLIVDCFEVETEKPSVPKAANTHHSAYKMKHTVKFLIVMDASGAVAFISNSYGGRCSDRFIAQSSGFLNIIQPNDVILADKGFDIGDLIREKGATLNIPTFLRKNTQLNPLHIESDKQITALRVHVERLIGVLKSKFCYLAGRILVTSLRRSENSMNSVDLVVRVCCMLLNFNEPIL